MPSPNNPFPGPQPYGPADRHAFFGRDRAILRLSDAILASRVLTVFGPSGAGKSSLLQAGVLPQLEERWDVRAVVVDAWPPRRLGEQGVVGWLVGVLCEQLGVGSTETLDEAMHLAFRRSDRAVVLVLDQLEQLLAYQDYDQLTAFVDALSSLAGATGLPLHVVLTLREDWFGRWTALLRGRPRLVRETFRLPRLSVEDMTAAVQAALAVGVPPQRWDAHRLRDLIAEMAVPGQWRTDAAEVESAYVQIVCRVLWERGGLAASKDESPARILDAHLYATLASLGPLGSVAEDFLQERLITKAGTRVPVPREVAVEAIGDEADAERILHTLEQARILRAQAHEGDRIYELGHDWLALSIGESAKRRREAAAQKRRRQRRIGVGLLLIAALLVVLYFNRLRRQAEVAEASARTAQAAAERSATEAEQSATTAREAQREADAKAREALDAKERAVVLREDAERARSDALVSAAAARQAEDLAVAAEAEARVAAVEARQQRSRAEDTLRLLAARRVAGEPFLAAAWLRDMTDPQEHRAWLRAAATTLQRLTPTQVWQLDAPPFTAGSAEPIAPRGTASVVVPGGDHLIVATPDGRLAAVPLRASDGGPAEPAPVAAVPLGESAGAGGLVLAGTAQGLVAVGGADGAVWTWDPWDAGTSAPCRRYSHATPITSLYVSAAGDLYSADVRGDVRISPAAATRGPCRSQDATALHNPDREVVWAFFDLEGRVVGLTGSGRLLPLEDSVGDIADVLPGDQTVAQAVATRAGVVVEHGALPVRVGQSNAPLLLARADRRPSGLAGYTRSLDVDDSGDLALVLAADGVARLYRWDPDEGLTPGYRLVAELTRPSAEDLKAHQTALDPDGRVAAVAYQDGTTEAWLLDAKGRPSLRRDLRASTPTVSLSFDVGRLYDVREDGRTLSWSPWAPALAEPLAVPPEVGAITGLCFEGERVVAATASGAVLVWDAERGRDGVLARQATRGAPCEGQVSAGGRTASVEDGVGVVRPEAANHDAMTLDGHPAAITAITLSRDGALAASTDGATVLRWDLGPPDAPWPAWGERLAAYVGGWCLPALELEASLGMTARRAEREHAACVAAATEAEGDAPAPR